MTVGQDLMNVGRAGRGWQRGADCGAGHGGAVVGAAKGHKKVQREGKGVLGNDGDDEAVGDEASGTGLLRNARVGCSWPHMSPPFPPHAPPPPPPSCPPALAGAPSAPALAPRPFPALPGARGGPAGGRVGGGALRPRPRERGRARAPRRGGRGDLRRAAGAGWPAAGCCSAAGSHPRGPAHFWILDAPPGCGRRGRR